jgi:hypothetical protein
MSRIDRFAPLSAFLFTLLLATAFILLGETPSIGDSADKVANFYKDNETETFISSALVSLASIALVWFGSSLRTHIRRREGEAGWLASLPFAATIMIAVGGTIFAGIEATAADAAGDLPAGAIQTINAFDNDMFFTLAAGTLLMYISLSVAIFRFRVFPKWLGWVTAIFAIASVTPAGFFVFLLSGIVFPLLGVLIYREGDASGRPAAPRQA